MRLHLAKAQGNCILGTIKKGLTFCQQKDVLPFALSLSKDWNGLKYDENFYQAMADQVGKKHIDELVRELF